MISPMAAGGYVATFAVERHNGAVWLCAVSAQGVEMLARFCTSEDAEAFKRINAAQIASAHAAGASGI